MDLYRFSGALTCLVALLSAGCGTTKPRDISTSDPYFKNIIGRSICTQEQLYLARLRLRLRDGDVSFRDLREFILSGSVYYGSRVNTKSDLSFEEFISADFTIPPGAHQSVKPVAKGTRLKIENVYSYNSSKHSGYIVMASVSYFPVGSKNIDVGSIFDRGSTPSLLPEYGEFC